MQSYNQKKEGRPQIPDRQSARRLYDQYNNPPLNEIVFPAGILQYPYFDFAADDAINYGGIGMVIGHEMTHAFDDQGAQYDKDGNVKNWWTKEDHQKFRERTQQLSNLYSTFTVLDNVQIKGEF